MAWVLPVLPWREWVSFCHELVMPQCLFRHKTYGIGGMGLASFAHRDEVLLNVVFPLLDAFSVSLLEEAAAELDVGNERVTSALGEVFSYDDTEHLDIGVGSHGVGGDDPTS